MVRHSIFTPVYNRKSELFNLASHIENLNYPKSDFEWIIIDDGSTDGLELEIYRLKEKYSDITIRYVKKDNGGIHTAQNCAVRLAEGAFFTRIDSDDYLLPDALLIKDQYIAQYGADSNVAGVVGLCLNAKDLSIRGVAFPKDVMVSKGYILRNKYNVYGDRNFCIKISVMREFLIPEFDDTNWVPEGSTLWLNVDKHYDTVFVNQPMSVCMEPNENSVTGQLKKETLANVMSGYYGGLHVVNNGRGYYPLSHRTKCLFRLGLKMLQAKKYSSERYGLLRGFRDLQRFTSKLLYCFFVPMCIVYYLLLKR